MLSAGMRSERCALGSGWEHGGAQSGQAAVGPQGLPCHCRCGYYGPFSTVQAVYCPGCGLNVARSAAPGLPLALSGGVWAEFVSSSPRVWAQSPGHSGGALRPSPHPHPASPRRCPCHPCTQSLAGRQLVSGIHQTRGSSRISRALSIAPSPRDVGRDVGQRTQTHSAPCGASAAPGSRPWAVIEALCLSFPTRGGDDAYLTVRSAGSVGYM